MRKKISFIGFGNIAKAIATGAEQAGVIENSQVLVSSPSCQQGRFCPYSVARDNVEAAKRGNILFLAVKPDQIAFVCGEIANDVDDSKLIVSVAAGKATDTIAQYLRCPTIPIIRAMPNTPVALKSGVTGFYQNQFVTSEQSVFITQILNALGIVERIEDEQQIDLITAVSGSGPAYFMYLAEAIANAAAQRGLSEECAQRIVKQTLYGTGILMNATQDTFALKRAQVTSKRGTTAAGIACLEEANFVKLVDSMIDAAYCRAKEISSVD